MDAQSPPLPGRLARAVDGARVPPLAWWLLGLLVAATAFAAFSGGAIDIPAESRLQAGIATLVIACGVGLAAGGLTAGRAPLAWGGVALLASFAVWSAISLSWSVAPDESWIAANRAFAYTALAAIALVSASSLRGPAPLVAVALAAAGLLVALYALGGKLAPGFHIGPLDLNPGDRFARLREPIDYWNGLGLVCVMACPALIWLAASRSMATGVRIVSVLALAVISLTAALTYSRGAIIAYAAMLAMLVVAGPDRLKRLAVGLGVPLAMTPAILVAFGSHGLSADSVPLSERQDAGLVLAAVLGVSLAGLAAIAWRLSKLEARVSWSPRRSHVVWRGLAALAIGLLLAGVGALAVSERGLTGEISHQLDQFSNPQGRPGNTPERLISSNGSNRYVWWQEAVGAFSDKPVAGWGAGSFPVLHYLYRRYNAPVRTAHSLPLQLLSETGLIGAALGLGGLGLLWAAAVGQVRGSAGVERSARLVLLAAATAWLVHSLYDWDWEIPAVAVPALIAVCVAAAPSPRRRPEPPPRATAAAAAVAVTLAAIGLGVSAALPALSRGEQLNAFDLSAQGSLQEAAADAELAHDLNPLSVEPLFTLASIANAQGRRRIAAGFLEEATETQPENWQTWRRLATIDAQIGERGVAETALKRLTETDPLKSRGMVSSITANLFNLQVPPTRSPTAFGTPPP